MVLGMVWCIAAGVKKRSESNAAVTKHNEFKDYSDYTQR